MAGYSAEVSLELEIDGVAYKLGHCGPGHVMIHQWEKKPLPIGDSLDGTLIVTVDGNASSSRIHLPGGVKPSSTWTDYESKE